MPSAGWRAARPLLGRFRTGWKAHAIIAFGPYEGHQRVWVIYPRGRLRQEATARLRKESSPPFIPSIHPSLLLQGNCSPGRLMPFSPSASYSWRQNERERQSTARATLFPALAAPIIRHSASLARSVLNMPSPAEPCQPATPALFSISPSRPFSRSRSISSSPSNSTPPTQVRSCMLSSRPCLSMLFLCACICREMKISNAR